MNNAYRKVKDVETSLTNKDVKLKQAKEELMKRVGPRGLQNLVETRMKTGNVLPFRVSLKKNSRHALVTWEPMAKDLEDPMMTLHSRTTAEVTRGTCDYCYAFYYTAYHM